MATVITCERNGEPFEIKFTKSTVRQLFKLGFSFDMMKDNPLEATELLAYCSMLASNRFIKREEAIEFISSFCEDEEGGDNLIATLVEMVNETFEGTMLKRTGNVKWQVSR